MYSLLRDFPRGRIVHIVHQSWIEVALAPVA